MTGYGLARLEDDEKSIVVEIKTLNSKFTDLSVRLPKTLYNKEIEIRNLLTGLLERGKITVSVEYLRKRGSDTNITINEDLFKKYYQKLNDLATAVGTPTGEIFKIALQLPEVMVPLENESQKERAWGEIRGLVQEAAEKCNDFRMREGNELSEKLKSYIKQIRMPLTEIENLDPERVKRIKSRIKDNLNDLPGKEEIDENRLEQELIYYIEKIDISEEKVRLDTHLNHFIEILEEDWSNGKKLNFVSQEIGREINTIGSKANNAAIQRQVINMKEALEKIKEQTLNIL